MSAGELMLYVSCAGSREIVRFAMDRESGALDPRGRTALPGPPPAAAPEGVIAPSYSVPLAISPGGAFLFAVLRTPPFAVLSYRIDPVTGALTLLAESKVPESTPYMHCDRSGRLLFGAAYQGNCIWVSAIDGEGRAAPPHQIVGGIEAPHCILPDPDNRAVYVAEAGGDRMLQFGLDAESGHVAPTGAPVRLPQATRPRHLAFHPRAPQLYCLTESLGLIDVYAVDRAAGRLTLLPDRGERLPAFPGSEHVIAADLHFTPDGRFLYGSERTGGSISAFAVAPGTGALSLVGTYPTDRVPRSFAIDPGGRFLAAAGQETGRVVVHAIDPHSGALGDGVAYRAGAGPGWVAFVGLGGAGTGGGTTQ